MSFAPFKTIFFSVFSRKDVAGIPDSVPRSWNSRNIFLSLPVFLSLLPPRLRGKDFFAYCSGKLTCVQYFDHAELQKTVYAVGGNSQQRHAVRDSVLTLKAKRIVCLSA
jgi:hypothetical protein